MTNAIDINIGWYFTPQSGFYFGGNIHLSCPSEEKATPKVEAEATESPQLITESEEAPVQTAEVKAETSKPMTSAEKKAIEEVLSAKNRKDVTVNEKTKVNEETLYAASVYRKLSKEDRKEFLEALRDRSAVLKGKGDPSFYKATNEALNHLIREKKLSTQDFNNIKRYALGKAQLDSDKSNITRKSQRIGNGSDGSALDKLRENKAATNKELRAFEKSSADKSASSKVSSNQTLKTNGGQSSSGSEKFLWKPVSDSDGKLAVLLPSSLTGDVSKVTIEAPDGKVIGQGRFSGVGNGEREHYRFSQAGGSYPDGSRVLIYFKDGSVKEVEIKETSSRVQR